VDVKNPKGTLVEGMYAEVSLVLRELKGALTVPIQAVTRNGNMASVLVVDPQDRVETRQVELGMEGPSRVAVVSGLTSGDRVVIGNASDFHPGEKVQPKPFQEAANTEEF
jgi:multidrug efflux pump subunit AcrA (membrane-fusion protein)